MKGYLDDIEQVTLDNGDFRRVLYTGHNLQLAVHGPQNLRRGQGLTRAFRRADDGIANRRALVASLP